MRLFSKIKEFVWKRIEMSSIIWKFIEEKLKKIVLLADELPVSATDFEKTQNSFLLLKELQKKQGTVENKQNTALNSTNCDICFFV